MENDTNIDRVRGAKWLGHGAYEIAFSGGKHGGLLRWLAALPAGDIRRSIRSWEAKILKHIAKVEKPEEHVAQWCTLDARRQKGIKNSWRKEIRRFAEEIDVAEGVLRNRGLLS